MRLGQTHLFTHPIKYLLITAGNALVSSLDFLSKGCTSLPAAVRTMVSSLYLWLPLEDFLWIEDKIPRNFWVTTQLLPSN